MEGGASRDDFFFAMARKPKPRRLFQLPFAAFLLRACGCDNFFEQKIQLAGAEQIEGCANRHARRCRARGTACAIADIRAEIRGVSGDDKKILACARAGQSSRRRQVQTI